MKRKKVIADRGSSFESIMEIADWYFRAHHQVDVFSLPPSASFLRLEGEVVLSSIRHVDGLLEVRMFNPNPGDLAAAERVTQASRLCSSRSTAGTAVTHSRTGPPHLTEDRQDWGVQHNPNTKKQQARLKFDNWPKGVNPPRNATPVNFEGTPVGNALKLAIPV
jgi:hypothetical protein